MYASGEATAAVVDVHAEHVAGAVQGPSRIDLGARVERLLRGDRKQAHRLQAVSEHAHRRVVGGEEGDAGTDRLDAGLLRGVHKVVEVALDTGVAAVDRQRAGDVGGVEVVALDAHVEQDQLAGVDRARVLDPVQRRWRAGRRRRSSRSRCRCPSRGRDGRRCPRSSARRSAARWPSPARRPRSRGSSMSQASWSSPISQSSLTSRTSETTRARSSSRDSSAATSPSTVLEMPRSTRVLAEPARASGSSSTCRTSRPSESEISRSDGRRPTHSSPYCRSRKNSSVSREELGLA